MARIYAPNEDYNQKGIGVEFYNGAGASTNAAVIANLQAKGYSIDNTKAALTALDKLTKDELAAIAQSMGLAVTKIVEGDPVNLTKQELVASIETFVNAAILPLVPNVTSADLTNLDLTLSEALFDGGVAVANNADLKDKFVATGCTITSAIYTSANKKITFIIAESEAGNTIEYTGDSLTDSAGGILGNLSYTAGAEDWGETA